MGNSARMLAAGLLLGIGLGSFVDGIVLHQILQWHHLLTSEGSHPANTVARLEANTLADGLFHAFAWVAVCVGLWLLWRAGRRASALLEGRRLVGLMLAGWGLFNLLEGLVDYQCSASTTSRSTRTATRSSCSTSPFSFPGYCFYSSAQGLLAP